MDWFSLGLHLHVLGTKERDQSIHPFVSDLGCRKVCLFALNIYLHTCMTLTCSILELYIYTIT